LAARERGRRLAEMNVPQADALERLDLAPERRDRAQEIERLLDRHLEHVCDRAALVLHLERLAIVAPPVAQVAADEDIGQEVHLDLLEPVALAALAAPALHVEREPPRAVAAHLGLRELREQVADEAERAGGGGGIGARRAPDRA